MPKQTLQFIPPNSSEAKSEEKIDIVKLARQWGGASCDAFLDPSCLYYYLPSIEGAIGYRLEKRCAIVYGNPVCSQSDQAELAKAFHDYCKIKGWSIIYISASDEFTKWTTKRLNYSWIEYGQELYLNPHSDPQKEHGTHASLVRRKVRHAFKEGVSVEEYQGQDKQIERALEELAAKWLNNRKKPQIHISNVYLFDNRLGKRWMYAKRNDTILGIIVLNELQSRKGWLINHLMITPDAPGGTPELLVISALQVLVNENCQYVTFGSIPAKELGEMMGFSIFSRLIGRFAFSLARKIFKLDGLGMFWEKFHPNATPSYIVFSHPHIRIREIQALLKALNANRTL
jgi:lysylphosphatidylglycerol synthetase-like protein (DUF2156 family)